MYEYELNETKFVSVSAVKKAETKGNHMKEMGLNAKAQIEFYKLTYARSLNQKMEDGVHCNFLSRWLHVYVFTLHTLKIFIDYAGCATTLHTMLSRETLC